MPEIRELLQDAAPTPRPYDEGAVRARVVARRRRRRAIGGATSLVAVLAVVGVVVALDAPDGGETVIAQPGPAEPSKQAGITAVAVADGEVIIGDETGNLGREDRSYGVAAPGPVRRIEVGDEIWAAGDTWVGAVHVEGVSLGFWDAGETVADVQPLEDQQAAVALPDGDAVAIVAVADDGIEEVARIVIGAKPTALVRTHDGHLWVSDGEVIRRIDVNAGAADDEQPWSGALLAPSLDGGIWTTDGGRLVDLFPDELEHGQSVAVGERWDVEASSVVETEAGIWVGGPDGITFLDRDGHESTTVTTDEPASMAVDGDDLVYVTGGVVRRFAAEVAPQVEVEDRSAAGAAASAFVVEVLGWGPHAIGSPETWDGRTLTATMASSDHEAELTMAEVDGEWQVIGLWTLGGERYDDGASVSLGNGADSVYLGYREEGLTPELTVHYGDTETVRTGEPGGEATWDGDLGFVPDTEGWVQVLFRDADGVALEGWRSPLPAGPFAAG